MIRRSEKQLVTVLLAVSLAGCELNTEDSDSVDGMPPNFYEAISADSDAKAFSLYLADAERGYASAQFQLGIMYSEGKGVPQNFAEATKWLTLAAEKGNSNYQHDLGSMYASGSGLPQNYTEAVRWYRLAAKQGNGSSQSKLGLMYAKGQGVPRDNVMAYVWYSLAETEGHIVCENSREQVQASLTGLEEYFVCENSRDIAARQLTPEQLARGQEIAARCFKSNYTDCE